MLTRRGFTLLEMVAALAIAAIITAALLPSIMSRLDRGESGALIRNIDSLVDAIALYRQDVGVYPRQLAYLSTPIAAGAQDACANAVATASLALWRGPYLDRTISSAGLPSGGSVISNTLSRDGAATTTVSNLVISVSDVDQAEAAEVDAKLDGDGSLTTGGVRWSVAPATPGRGTLSYRIPIRGC